MENTIVQPPELKGKWVRVQVYTAGYTYTGRLYCAHLRRLLDVLNDATEEFLPLGEAKVRSLDGKETAVPSAYINKASALFVKEIGEGESRGLGSQAGQKPYPFVGKVGKGVRVNMPFYTLSGQAYCARSQQLKDVLNSETRFLPLTDVNLHSLTGASEAGVSFLAVNKGQIISLEE
jgi:hypothetical protein